MSGAGTPLDGAFQHMRIGLDCDGVLFNFENSLRAYLRHRGYDHPMPDPQRWYFHDDWGLTLDEFKEACNEGVNEGFVFSYGVPYEGAVEAVHRIKDAGHSVHVITARSYGNPGVAQHATAHWLAKWNIPYDTLTFSRDKTVVPTDFMAEDNCFNYDVLDEASCYSFLIDRPWNDTAHDGIFRRRVADLKEFADIVIEEG